MFLPNWLKTEVLNKFTLYTGNEDLSPGFSFPVFLYLISFAKIPVLTSHPVSGVHKRMKMDDFGPTKDIS